MKISNHELRINELRERQMMIHELNLKELQKLNCQKSEKDNKSPPVQNGQHIVDVKV